MGEIFFLPGFMRENISIYTPKEYANSMIEKMLNNTLSIDEKNMIDSIIYILPKEVSEIQRDILSRVAGTLRKKGESFKAIAKVHSITKEEAGMEFLRGAGFLAKILATNSFAASLIERIRSLESSQC